VIDALALSCDRVDSPHVIRHDGIRPKTINYRTLPRYPERNLWSVALATSIRWRLVYTISSKLTYLGERALLRSQYRLDQTKERNTGEVSILD